MGTDKALGSAMLVSYLTPVSDLDLIPDTDQFMASPPIRYINPGCCVKNFQKSNVANSVVLLMNLTMMA